MKTNIQLKACLIIIVLTFQISNVYSYTKKDLLQKKVSKEDIVNLLINNQKWVRYPEYKNRKQWDNFFGEYKSQYIKKGQKALDYEWKVITANYYLEYERSGNRKIMENPLKDNNTAIVTLFLAELAEGKGRFIDKLVDGVFSTCEMTSWTISAHLTRQKTKRSLPDKSENIIALVTGDMGSMMSWIHYFFHDEFDKINPEISRRLREELDKRILAPFLNRDFWWMGFKEGVIVNNWNPWCNCNVLQTFMLIEKNKKRLAKAVYRTMQSVDEFINYSNADGACEEGSSYWGHAAGKLYDYLQLLSDVTGGKVSLFNEPMIKRMGEFIAKSYVGDGWVVNFADASAKLNPQPDLVYAYGKAVNSDEMKSFASYLLKLNNKNNLPNNGRDIFRTLQALQYREELKKHSSSLNSSSSTWYPNTEFCYMRTSKKLFFAAKGGFNNESHNHNDVGTFSLYVDNTPIFIDAGVGTYTRQTFSSERYNIWTMQSLYHNLPEINGNAQQYGRQFKSDNVKFNKKKRLFSLNIAKAYKDASIDSWTRTYSLKDNSLIIKDKFSIKNPRVKNKLHFMTWGNVVLDKNSVKIEVRGKKVTLKFDETKMNYSIKKIKLTDPRLTKVWGNEIFRVTLEAKKLMKNGQYKVVISN